MSRTRLLALRTVGASLLLLLMGGVAFAGGIDFEGALGAIPESICNGARFLRGPVGGILAVGAIIWGVVRAQLGQRGGIGLIVGGAVGGLILVAIPTMVAIFQIQNCAL